MANIKERDIWEEHIYQIETSDPVLGGENGIANRQAAQLGARTKYLKNEVEKRAPAHNPAFTGAPTAPTPEQSANNKQIATTAFVKAVVAALVGSSPVALDTLNELAAALGNDPNFSRTILNRLAQMQTALDGKAEMASPTFTGSPKAPTPAQTVNDTTLATTAFVKTAIATLVGSSPVALDTLNELAAALGNDPNFSRTILNLLAQMQTSLESKANTATTLAGYGISDFKLQNYTDRNLNNYRTDGVYCFGSGYNISNAPGQFSGNLQVITGGVGNERWCHQIFYRHYSVEVYRRWQIANDNDDWSPWIRVDAGDWVAMRNRPLDVITNLGDRDLNTIVTPGFYGQQLNDNVTIARNYPEAAQAGTLLVGPSAYGVQQEYTTFYSYNKYVRNQHHNGWGSWKKIGSLDALIGIPLPYPGRDVPAGFVSLNGQSFSRTTYPLLAQRYPSGVLPDLRGEFLRGWDNGRGVDGGRELLSAQGDAIRNITAHLGTDNGWIFRQPQGAFYDHTNGQNLISARATIERLNTTEKSIGWVSFDASRVVPTAAENRPRNIAYQYICLVG